MIQASLGISCKQWLQQTRLLEVEKRLAGEESIAEIAHAVGFSHPKELSREFRKNTASPLRNTGKLIFQDRIHRMKQNYLTPESR
jgi:AraC-like DNA-binding protein